MPPASGADRTAAPAPAATGEQLLQIARAHLGEAYVLGVQVPKDNASWKGPWDCSEFASWVVFQAIAILYGCDRDYGDPATADAYTGYWARDATNLGRIVPIAQAASMPGAAVLRTPQVGAHGHIVISDGAGGTVEAHSSKDGVVQLSLAKRRWDTGILVPGVVYTQRPPVSVTPPATAIYRLMLPMMTGKTVRDIQEALAKQGFSPGQVDGEFGPHTHAAVVAFQLSRGLVPDGEVSSVTADALGVTLPPA
jgi:hypothetical protein